MLKMNHEEMDKVVNDHFMFEATDNIEGVLGTLTDDILHEMIGGPDGVLTGKQRVRGFYEALFPQLTEGSVEPVFRVYSENKIIDETIWTGVIHDARVFNLPGLAGKAAFRLLHVFHMRDGLIAKENVWFDGQAIRTQLA